MLLEVLYYLVGHRGRACDLRGSGKTQQQEVEHEAVVLEDERRELETSHQTVRICVHHVLVTDTSITFQITRG